LGGGQPNFQGGKKTSLFFGEKEGEKIAGRGGPVLRISVYLEKRFLSQE